ncbi:hypothetical protein DFH09DRAFT_1105119 [Mycena vulgaris]|nr:hypothetical protein DFH09DRAFT_1105119 [Mycena vulgaris]
MRVSMWIPRKRTQALKIALSSSVESDGCADPVAITSECNTPAAAWSHLQNSQPPVPNHRARALPLCSRQGVAWRSEERGGRGGMEQQIQANEWCNTATGVRFFWLRAQGHDNIMIFKLREMPPVVPPLGRAGVPRLASAPHAASNNALACSIQSHSRRLSCSIERKAGRRFRSKIKGRAEFKAKILIRTDAGLIAHLQLWKHQRVIATGHAETTSIEEMVKQGPARRTQRCAAREREDGSSLWTRAHSRERVRGEQRDSPLALLPPGTPRMSNSTPWAGNARARNDRDLGSPRARSLHRPARTTAACASMSRIPANTGAWRTPASARRNVHTVFLLVLVPPNAARASSAARARVGAAPRRGSPRTRSRSPGRRRRTLALAPHLRALVASPTPCPAPRWPRTRTPERRAHASLTTSPAASPQVRGLGVSLATRLPARARARRTARGYFLYLHALALCPVP